MTLPELEYGTAADAAARDMRPGVIYEDRNGTWWQEVDGVLNYNLTSFKVTWTPNLSMTWATLIATRGELWPVPDFIPCELGDARTPDKAVIE